MSIAKVIEITAPSPPASKTRSERPEKPLKRSKNIKGAWINETKVVTSPDGTVTEWRVNMRISFVVE